MSSGFRSPLLTELNLFCNQLYFVLTEKKVHCTPKNLMYIALKIVLKSSFGSINNDDDSSGQKQKKKEPAGNFPLVAKMPLGEEGGRVPE